MRIASIGVGKVGAALAVRWTAAGHEVTIAESREGSPSVTAVLARSPKLVAKPIAVAVQAADVITLATPFSANEAIVKPLADALAGKVLIDCTNPVGPGLTHGLKSESSGSAWLQSLAPKAHVVKAFSIYGYENFEDPNYPDYPNKAAMLFCGDDVGAKARAAELIRDCGFEPVDVGGLVQALHLEHMTLLWVRMVRAGGHSANLVWGALRR
jgi:hypothetical protein